MKMPILFSAVVCDKVVVEQFATCDGNFGEIVELLMRKIPELNSKMTYSFGRYLLHYIKENGRFYFCITDTSCQRSRAFLFLNEVKRENKRKILAKQMFRYNEDYGSVVIRRGELEEINSIGVDSSESLFGESLIQVEDYQNLRYTTYCETTPGNASVPSERKLKYSILAVVIVGLSSLVYFPSQFFYSMALILLLIVMMMHANHVVSY